MRWQPRHTMYLAVSLSAWGDRMWTFAVGIYMVYATPNSLRLTAIYGLVISISVILLGATVGRWVDNSARLRAAQVSLVVQNSSVCTCAVLLIVGLQYAEYTASTWNGWLRILLQVLVIAVADVAALATVANKITIEKDWIVVMSGGDDNALAWMNSAFRTIDLTTFMLAPVLVGQLMTYLSPVAAAAFMAVWNVLSLAVEYTLLKRVYRGEPRLAHAKRPDSALAPLPADIEPAPLSTDAELAPLSTDTELAPSSAATRAQQAAAAPAGCCGRQLADLRLAWAAYFRSPFRLAGLALASLYMTVLGFGSVTSGYGFSQGLTESTLGILTAAGAFVGILGSLCFPKLRSSIGPAWAGVAGFSLAVLAQLLSVVSVLLPGTAWAPVAAADAPPDRTSVAVLFTGMILARFGLWVSDLSVTQLLQELVPESRRGVIGGVQTALNMTMETTNLVLVICVPSPRNFGALVIASFTFWVIGWCLFAAHACGYHIRPVGPAAAGTTPDLKPAVGDVTDGHRAAAACASLLDGGATPGTTPDLKPAVGDVTDRHRAAAVRASLLDGGATPGTTPDLKPAVGDVTDRHRAAAVRASPLDGGPAGVTMRMIDDGDDDQC